MTDSKKTIRVVAGVLHKDGRYLIAQRLSGTLGAGAWEFPGGKIEPDETEYAALVRELNEELGIETLAAQPLLSLTHEYPERFVALSFFAVTAWRGAVNGREGQAIRWCPRDEMLSVDWLPANLAVVDRLLVVSKY
ncbi:MAG: (deoxy)nucleoside triphosphate pyrophosphohydrolase [Pseudomonadota bacterium]